MRYYIRKIGEIKQILRYFPLFTVTLLMVLVCSIVVLASGVRPERVMVQATGRDSQGNTYTFTLGGE